MLSYRLKPFGLYRHRRGLGLHRVGYKGGDLHIRIAKLAIHEKESPTRTWDEVQSCIFIVQESGRRYSPAIRTPPNPGLPQRSLALGFCASNHKSAWQPLLPSAKGLSFTFIFYPYTRVMVIFTFPYYTCSFGKHYVLEKDPDIYIRSDVRYHKVLLLTLPLI